MPDFYTEQVLTAPLTTAAERLLIARLDVCAREYGARSRECLVDGERRRMVCRFEADDLRAARAAARCSGLDHDATWFSPARIAAVPVNATGPVSATRSAALAGGDTATRFVDVIAECRPNVPLDMTALRAELHACAWCLDAFRVRPGPVVVSADGRRVLVLFRAPDAEAVRMAHRHTSVSFDRVVALRRIGTQASDSPRSGS